MLVHLDTAQLSSDKTPSTLSISENPLNTACHWEAENSTGCCSGTFADVAGRDLARL
jgi:hypothetical protein